MHRAVSLTYGLGNKYALPAKLGCCAPSSQVVTVMRLSKYNGIVASAMWESSTSRERFFALTQATKQHADQSASALSPMGYGQT